MPYIAQGERDKFTYVPNVKDGGELQFVIARIIQKHFENKDEVRYKDMEAIMGALIGAQQEFYRVVVAPYEDQKIEQNGGVYDASKYGKGGY